MGQQTNMRDKVVVVTGASQGLGQFLSLELAAQGAKVVLVARNQARLDEICAQITAAGGTAFSVPTDVANEAECDRMIEATVSRFGGIDVLVLNAGSATYGRLDELHTFAPIRDSMAINFFGAAYPTYRALDHLKARKGLIAYVTSGSGHLPMAGYLGYTTSKHAMNGFFEALRLEMIPHGVSVLAINPGDMYSDDGAGRTFFAPDGSQHKIDLSIKRDNDIARVPASAVAKKSADAILRRRRDLDLSPAIQKLGTVARAIAPSIVDQIIYRKVARMRSAFASEAGLLADQRK
jgi:NAD(P)-dependent dehydrogenase (short-subunit alcohol dehydrogenase family)